MRPEAKQNLSDVAAEIIKNPLAPSREIAKNVGISKSTVNNKLAELGQGVELDRTSAVVAISATDLEIVTLGQSIILDKLRDGEYQKKVNIGEVSQVIERSQKRQAFIDGANSDKGGGEKKNPFSGLTTDELRKAMNE